MKPRGIWMIIGLILVIGIGTTAYIRDYTQNTELVEIRQVQALGETAAASVSEEEAPQSDGAAMAKILPGKSEEADEEEAFGAEIASEPMAETANRAVLAAPAQAFAESESEMPEEAGAPAAGAQDSVMAPAAPAAFSAAEDKAAEMESETAPSVVLNRLNDLDEQIAKSQSQKAGDTTNSQKAASETERKLWEAELSQFLDVLEAKLEKEEKDALMKEQNEWIRQRENTALEASGKQNSSVRQELEYNISMAESTRIRVYELAQEYREILSEAEK